MKEETLGMFLKRRREEMNIGIREMCRLSERNPDCGRKLTSGYCARIENDDPKVKTDKISMDFFWAVGVVLGVDPLKLFVMSRQNIPEKMLKKEERDKTFKLV